MLKKKGQLGAVESTIVIAVTAILLLVLVLVFAKIGTTGDTQLTGIESTIVNETVSGSFNTSLSFANTRRCTGVTVFNATPTGAPAMTEGLFPAGNYTTSVCSINVHDAGPVGDTIGVKVSYAYENATNFQTTYANIRSTTLDAWDLLVIGLIVLGAVLIISLIATIGRR